MKRFFCKLVIYILATALVYSIITISVITVISPQYSGGYQASFEDKLNRLESLDSPKIILVGNSNLAFGMDSKMLSEKMGMPVVNLGLHGDLGNVFHENMAKLNIGQGDLVIVCHSDYDDTGKIINPAMAWITIENHYDHWGVISPRDIPDMAVSMPKYIERALGLYVERKGNLETEDAYCRSAFNEYGDNVYPRPERICSIEEFEDPKEPEYSVECVSRLNDLNGYCEAYGATMLVAGFPIADGKYALSTDVYKDFRKELDEELDCTIISDFSDYMYDYDYFYDSPLHLTDYGVKMRTEQLIEDLERWKAGIPI